MSYARRRKIVSAIAEALCAVAVILALLPLAMILFYVIKQGFTSLNWAFFTQMPKPVGEAGGGMANAIVGTLVLIAIAAVIAIPIVVRTTEELLRLVPSGLREGALALGATRSRAVFTVILPAALPGIITGILVALARVAGETAPLLFTAFNNRFWSTSLVQPIASLTVQVFTYAISPYDDWHRQAWAGAFLLVMMILMLSIAARFAVRRLERMNRP